MTGTSCVSGRCEATRTVVAVGDNCDQLRRCPYKSECIAGQCVEAVLNGEPCDAGTPCAAGVCSAGVCQQAAPPALTCFGR